MANITTTPPGISAGISEHSTVYVLLIWKCVIHAVVEVQAEVLLANGHREVLGRVDDHYWRVLEQYGHERPGPPGADAVGLALYGDECQVWDGVQVMSLCWMSESSPFLTDPPKSRFLIACVPTMAYVIQDKVNLTLQTLLQSITASLNEWNKSGVRGLFAATVLCKGDWKFLVQAFNLCRHYNARDKICFRCEATKSLEAPFTDVTEQATWRFQTACCPWNTPPALLQLHNFSLQNIGLDILHCWHLGVGRDLLSSTLVVLLRTNIFQGQTAPSLQICCFEL